MADRGRVVVVNAGFALWQGGRCVAAARWSDIQRLRAYHRATAGDALHLGVELVDGSVMELHEAAPGFDLYVDRATVTLPGMMPSRDWHHTLAAAAPDAVGIVLFERKTRRY